MTGLILDAICIGFLAIHAVRGARRTLVQGLLDLIGIVLPLLLALQLYRPLGAFLNGNLRLANGLADILGFLLVWLALYGLWHLFAGAVRLPLSKRVARWGLPRWSDPTAGVVLGLGEALVIAAVVIAPFALLPITPEVKQAVDSSAFASRIAGTTARFAPALSPLVASAADYALEVFPRTQVGEKSNLGLPDPGPLETDAAAEQEMLALLNQERARAGLPPLVVDERLREAARGHSDEMFRLSYFAHESPASGSPFDRLRRTGLDFLTAGENLAYAPSVAVAHRELMNSPSHRQNILSPDFRRVGIGVVRSKYLGAMFTQNFAD